MKCVCGYEIIDDIKALQDPFVLIQSKTIGENLYQNLFFEKNGKKFSISLYACPKCGTVKMDLKGL